MKVFIGGMNAAQSVRVRSAFPMLDLRFATSTDAPKLWAQRASGCDHVFSFGRFRKHQHDDALRDLGFKPYNRPRMLDLFDSLHDLAKIHHAENAGRRCA